MAEPGSGRAVRKRTGKAPFLLSRVPPGLSSGRRGRTRGARRVGDIYCFKLSPLLSFPCQEVFEDRKYSGDFVSGVSRNLWLAREFKARSGGRQSRLWRGSRRGGDRALWFSPRAVGRRGGGWGCVCAASRASPAPAPKGARPTSGDKLSGEGGCGAAGKLCPPRVCLVTSVRGRHPTPTPSKTVSFPLEIFLDKKQRPGSVLL